MQEGDETNKWFIDDDEAFPSASKLPPQQEDKKEKKTESEEQGDDETEASLPFDVQWFLQRKDSVY